MQAFNQEETEMTIFKEYLTKARKIANKSHLKTAVAVGVFLFFVFAMFAFSFYVGSYLIINKFSNSFKITSKGKSFAIQTMEV